MHHCALTDTGLCCLINKDQHASRVSADVGWISVHQLQIVASLSLLLGKTLLSFLSKGFSGDFIRAATLQIFLFTSPVPSWRLTTLFSPNNTAVHFCTEYEGAQLIFPSVFDFNSRDTSLEDFSRGYLETSNCSCLFWDIKASFLCP